MSSSFSSPPSLSFACLLAIVAWIPVVSSGFVAVPVVRQSTPPIWRAASFPSKQSRLMGYSTSFQGWFSLDKPLSESEARYLQKFSKTRRMKRDPEILKAFDDPTRTDVGLPLGEEGCYYVGDESGIVANSKPPTGQPFLWCQWVPTSDRGGIEWDEEEKFYYYIEWLQYIITHFLERWGYTLNGKVRWQGEDRNDRGTIVVVNNQISTTAKVRRW
jgi:hypothetical protein